jgi:hypothetical protein
VSDRHDGVREVGVGAAAVELVLEGGHEDVPRFRAFTRRSLGDHPGGLADDAAIVVTELVTNALLHGRPPVRLRLHEVRGGVRLEVADRGAELPVAVRRSSVAMTGRGLALVTALTPRGVAARTTGAARSSGPSSTRARRRRVGPAPRLTAARSPTTMEAAPQRASSEPCRPTCCSTPRPTSTTSSGSSPRGADRRRDRLDGRLGGPPSRARAGSSATVVHGFRGRGNAIKRLAL